MTDEDWPTRIDRLLRSQQGLATRQDLLRVAPVGVVDGYVASGRLRRVFPHVHTARGNPATGDRRLRAAVLCAGGPALLSHTTALAIHGVREHGGPVHVTIDESRRRSGSRDLVVHRRVELAAADRASVRGLPVTTLADSLVDAWPLIPRAGRRPTLVDAARRPDLGAEELHRAAARRPNIGGHRELVVAVDLVADGVRSELEALGVLRVFRHPSLPRSRGQLAVRCPDGITRHHDRAWEEAMLAVELDGAAFHSSPEQRAEDLARDALFASMGWLVLRFTYAEVLRDPDGVRAKVLAVYRMRVAQLRSA
ncbi:endonuclease domain-containing protein [Klenkia taihuensis]|uniref:Transcriptional regulator, AbiEi antitoxin, Type IV TA system n=1 Tax=Klenkia taihuensis TaxID=1225127 RepID=A0A1I1MRT7_9ACTN|nr:DUF559 domain-containing protein [Klenkia taihuensis]GHE12521.1 hypothetical protein GCM10011381_30840 [Klenkia taihuensis]SFC88069.1 Transcriptional regulator, AbiEi antitoxin, Type IV TA system [Klenkia taihuensis]